MQIQKRVTLISFLNTIDPPKKINTDENYWILIGEKGTIIERDNQDFIGRVLVLFDKNLDELNLQNHNPEKNCLWILETDLKYD